MEASSASSGGGGVKHIQQGAIEGRWKEHEDGTSTYHTGAAKTKQATIKMFFKVSADGRLQKARKPKKKTRKQKKGSRAAPAAAPSRTSEEQRNPRVASPAATAAAPVRTPQKRRNRKEATRATPGAPVKAKAKKKRACRSKIQKVVLARVWDGIHKAGIHGTQIPHMTRVIKENKVSHFVLSFSQFITGYTTYLKKVTKLSLKGVDFTKFKEDDQKLLFSHLRGLKELDISNCKLEKLPDTLLQLPGRSINVYYAGNPIEDNEANSLHESAFPIGKLHFFDVMVNI